MSARGIRSADPSAVPVTTKFAYWVRGSYQEADDWYSLGTAPPGDDRDGASQETARSRTAPALSRVVRLPSLNVPSPLVSPCAASQPARACSGAAAAGCAAP